MNCVYKILEDINLQLYAIIAALFYYFIFAKIGSVAQLDRASAF